MSAIFSQDRKYRYRLWRSWSAAESVAVASFCLLNPSIADEVELDPTLRRCAAFAKSWGCCGMQIVNLFALVSTDPKGLLANSDPVGPGNDDAILHVAKESLRTGGPFVVGWGANPLAAPRGRRIYEMLKGGGVVTQCLGTTKSGMPRHPLYLRKDTQLEEWAP